MPPCPEARSKERPWGRSFRRLLRRSLGKGRLGLSVLDARQRGMVAAVNSPQLLSANNMDATAPLSRSVSATKDGFTIMVCAVYGNSTTRTLSGLSPDYTVSPVASMQFIGGSIENTTGTATGTVTGGTTGNWCVAMASFR